MGKGRIATGVLSFALLGAAFGYALASAFVSFLWFGPTAEIDFLIIARSYADLRITNPGDMTIVHLIVGISTAAGLLLSAILMNDLLTRFGETHWQTPVQQWVARKVQSLQHLARPTLHQQS